MSGYSFMKILRIFDSLMKLFLEVFLKFYFYLYMREDFILKDEYDILIDS